MMSIVIATSPDEVADSVRRFFAEHEVASLQLPTGWFGRPYDNFHQLTRASAEGGLVEICLDEVQILRVHASRAESVGRTLEIRVSGGSWRWTSYGATDTHDEPVGAGTVKLHAPFGR
jgi:hypothetical protein